MPTISGTVYDELGQPVAGRIVRAYRRDTGAFLGESVTGDGSGSSSSRVGDPYFGNVSLLLHMDGTNGSTTFTDSSPNPKTFTVSGNAQISTTQSKFGGASGLFDGSGGYISAPTNSDFDLLSSGKDFTVEFWLRLTNKDSANGNAILCVGSSAEYWQIIVRRNAFWINSLVGSYSSYSASVTLDNGVWHHYAWVYSSGVHRLFYDGTLLSPTGTMPGAVGFSTYVCYIGANYNGGTTSTAGYIDDVRITKGVARYTANFTPPTEPFPDAPLQLPLGQYLIDTGAYSGECYVVCLDDAAGTTLNDLILRTTPV